jgi:hypothetical protein
MRPVDNVDELIVAVASRRSEGDASGVQVAVRVRSSSTPAPRSERSDLVTLSPDMVEVLGQTVRANAPPTARLPQPLQPLRATRPATLQTAQPAIGARFASDSPEAPDAADDLNDFAFADDAPRAALASTASESLNWQLAEQPPAPVTGWNVLRASAAYATHARLGAAQQASGERLSLRA